MKIIIGFSAAAVLSLSLSACQAPGKAGDVDISTVQPSNVEQNQAKLEQAMTS